MAGRNKWTLVYFKSNDYYYYILLQEDWILLRIFMLYRLLINSCCFSRAWPFDYDASRSFLINQEYFSKVYKWMWSGLAILRSTSMILVLARILCKNQKCNIIIYVILYVTRLPCRPMWSQIQNYFRTRCRKNMLTKN